MFLKLGKQGSTLAGVMDASFFPSVREIVICAAPQTGVEPAVFAQPGQQVEQQENIAGSQYRVDGNGNVIGDGSTAVYIDQRWTVDQPGPSPESLRAAYLSQVMVRTRNVPLAGIDPKAAQEAGAGEDGDATPGEACDRRHRSAPSRLWCGWCLCRLGSARGVRLDRTERWNLRCRDDGEWLVGERR